ncbi:hypothetical protein, partial [Xanthomonas euvesicatoria]|uniref:hypothetical protein n=1 Tax=Xanthomonas euvesicatoria TaxID=456327 RepID=UPI001C4936E2
MTDTGQQIAASARWSVRHDPIAARCTGSTNKNPAQAGFFVGWAQCFKPSIVVSVSADVKLTHSAEVKVTHLGHDGGLL